MGKRLEKPFLPERGSNDNFFLPPQEACAAMTLSFPLEISSLRPAPSAYRDLHLRRGD